MNEGKSFFDPLSPNIHIQIHQTGLHTLLSNLNAKMHGSIFLFLIILLILVACLLY